MDNGQIEKKLEWLDERHRKDQEEIQRLKTQIKDVQESIGGLSKQLETITAEISRLAAAASRISQFDEAIAKHRSDISAQLKDAEERRTQKEKQLESLRSSDQTKLVKSIDELRHELKRIDEIEESLDARRSEDIRLNQELGALSDNLQRVGSDVADQKIQLVSLEESSTTEAKRISETETDISAIKRKSEDLRNAIDSVEDRARKVEIGVSELKANDLERSDQLEVWTDEQRMRLVEFEKKWSAWEKRFDDFEREARSIEEKIQAYDQTHRSIQQVQGQLEDLIQRLERRITEVGEMQRLSQERIKQDWAAFEADETKKWSTFKLSNDERWKEHQRVHEKLSAALETLEDLRSQIREDLDVLAQKEARKVNELVALTKQWLRDQE